MSYNVIPSTPFKKEFKRVSKKYRSLKEDVKKLIHELEANPLLGTDLGNGVRKVRMAITAKGRGKSHGARVITYTTALVNIDDEGDVILLYLYDKAERDAISKEEIANLIATLPE